MSKVQWRGWSAIEQGNGLITLRHVPQAGGGTLSLEINNHDAFLVNPQLQGITYPVHSRDVGVHFGGHYVNIGPEHVYSANEQPFNPHSGPYHVRYRNQQPNEHTISLSSREGTRNGATIAMARAITVYKGNTHVMVEEKVTNKGPEPLMLDLVDVTELDAVDRRQQAPSLRKLGLYVPVTSVGGKKSYDPLIMLQPQVDKQFDESLDEDILAINYAGRLFKIASHSQEQWLAAVDRDTGWTYVKTFKANGQARYVSGSGPIEVSGSTYNREEQKASVEMVLRTGLRKCLPNVPIEQREHWYATTCTGPVRRFTPVGVVCEPLSLAKEKGYYDLTGRFGVFHLGTARLELVDRDNAVLYASDPMPIDPRNEFVLLATLPAKAGAYDIVLKVFDHQHREVGELARADIR